MTTRIEPAVPPYPAEVAADFSALMPPGMPPIRLFRTLAKNPRVLGRVRHAGLLDPGSVTLRQRELVILRTCARCAAEYEWGVHAAYFGKAAGFDEAALHATVWLGADAACWNKDEALLVRACDALHDSAQVPDGLWTELREVFGEEQLLEVLVLAGFYHAIAYVVNVTGVALEEAATRFPARAARQ